MARSFDDLSLELPALSAAPQHGAVPATALDEPEDIARAAAAVAEDLRAVRAAAGASAPDVEREALVDITLRHALELWCVVLADGARGGVEEDLRTLAAELRV